MNTIWSTYVQKIDTLYLSRKLRFDDVFKEKFRQAFMIDGMDSILEIGCGPGALSQALRRWYPNAMLSGIDRDSRFIEFAAKQAPEIAFMEDDATCLSFPDNSFDVTISYTVQEHVEPSRFFGEQYRVLKDDGVCLVLSARRGINLDAPCIAEQTDFENAIWQKAEPYCRETLQKYSVCAYPRDEKELPLCMEQYGFKDVTTDYITINLTPDHPLYSAQMAHNLIQANRKGALDSAESLLDIASEAVAASEVDELKRIINDKYDKRIELYDRGIKQWDTAVSVTMVLRGIKRA